MINNIAFTGFGATTTISKKKHCGKRMRLVTEVNNWGASDLQTLRSLPEKFQDQKHVGKFVLDSFKTRKRHYFMLNGQLLDVNYANKDVGSKVLLLLKHIKRDIPSLDFRCFIEEAFMDKMIPKKSEPVKEVLNATGKCCKSIGKGFMKFFY